MCNISNRLEALNRQLIIVSKLQRMEEEYNPYATGKKCSVYSNLGKYCHCAQRVLSLKEQCNRSNCLEDCVSYIDSKRRIPCNSRTCKGRGKSHLYKNSQTTEDVNIRGNLIGQELQEPERHSKSDQINLTSKFYKMYSQDKIIDTYEEKSEQTIPTRDIVHAEISVNSSNTNYAQHETAKQAKSQTETEKSVPIELEGSSHSIEDICAKDKKIFETIQKDLANEKKRAKELEKKLKSLSCSINCLKEDSEQRAACLKGALETAEEQKKVAMDLMKRSKDQADLVKENRDELLNEIARLQQQITQVAQSNATLLKERDDLRNKLRSLSEDESKRCEEVEKEVNRMKYAVKEKENALSKERTEFMNMILELTNVINVQKRRISEVTGICNNQQNRMREIDQELSNKSNELSEVKSTVKEMEEKIEQLKYCIREETKACSCLKQELETVKESHSSELRIKEKIIEEQNKTISKQRKLLRDSKEMVQQVAAEFNELKDELQEEKEKNESLQVTLDETDSKLSKAYFSQCDKCKMLTDEIDYLKREKQKAVAIAKFAYQKLHRSTKEYQKKLICEKQQHRYMALIIEKKEHEIGCLRNQVCQTNIRII